MSSRIACLRWKSHKWALVGGAVVALAFWGARASQPTPSLVLLIVPASERVEEGVPPLYPEGTRLVRVRWGGEPLRDLVKGFQFAGGPKCSADGKRLLFAGRTSPSEPFRLWEGRSDGSRLREIPTGEGEATHPCYLPDGGIVFSGSVPENPRLRALFLLHRETSRRERLTFGEAIDRPYAVLRDGRILFWRETPASPSSGRWMTVHQDGTEVQRFYPERERGLPPVSTPDGKWLLDAERTQPRALYAVHPLTGEVGERLVEVPGYHIVAFAVVGRVERPPILTSIVDPKKTTGMLYCLDVRQSQDGSVAETPLTALKGVRITNGSGEALGFVPVGPDGSFFVEIPADTAVGMELVGSDGRSLATSPATIWVRPGEARGCVGCHLDPERAPENRAALALTKPPVRVGMRETSSP